MSSSRIAIVTGASGTIGRAIARWLAQRGVRVVAGYRTRKREAARTCRAIVAQGGKAVPFGADLRSADDLGKLIEAPREAFGSYADILVNNAACSAGSARGDLDDWDEALDTNLRAPGLASTLFAEKLGERRGDIINIASTAAFAPLARSPHYVASKAGLVGLTRVLALKLAPRVKVNSIAPGHVSGGRHRNLTPEGQAVLEATPLGRFVRPAEIAHAVWFLLQPDMAITGQVLTVDGGWSV